MVEVCLGLGSNLGDRLFNLSTAISLLTSKRIVSNVKTSKIYESKAVLLSTSPKEWDRNYYNMVIKCNSDLLPNKLLEQITAVEKEMGRVELGRWGPRVIDIDILTYGDEQYVMDNLKIPHPLMLNREWVVVPLASINPKWRYPVRGDYYMMTVQDIVQSKFNGESSTCQITDQRIFELEHA
jgi:2-amino-4-hydroxy-6-hydroxymethyldihydropteridine diphosphokinase